jgi:hypothetical protein
MKPRLFEQPGFFLQNPRKFVSIRRAGLTMFWESQAGAPNGHTEPDNEPVALQDVAEVSQLRQD